MCSRNTAISATFISLEIATSRNREGSHSFAFMKDATPRTQWMPCMAKLSMDEKYVFRWQSMGDPPIRINHVIVIASIETPIATARGIAPAQDRPEEVIVAHAQDHQDAAQNPGLNHLVGHVIATHDLQREMKAVLALEVHAERDLLPDLVPNLAPNQGNLGLGLNQNLAQGHPKIRSPDHAPSLPGREGL